MSINKRAKKSIVLTLGLVFGGLYASTNDIYAAQKEIVTASSLNVRKGASKEEEIISSLKEGTVVEIVESKEGWNKIKLSDDSEGWISADHTKKEKATVNATKLNVRKGPSIEDDKIELLDNGTVVEILEEQENWYKIEIAEDEFGWISGKYVTKESEVKKESAPKKKEVKSNNETVVESAVDNTQQNNNQSNNQVSDENKTESSVEPTEEKVEETQTTTNGSLMNVVATAYTGHTITATGTTPKWGTIAVDPKVIPYGTKVYIPKFDKVFIAEDCGGAIKGNKIDIFMDDEGSVYNWGRKSIEIQILGK